MENVEYLTVDKLVQDRVVIFEKNEDTIKHKQNAISKIITTKTTLIGMLTDDNRYHKYCGFNKFTVETFALPCKEEGWLDLNDQIILSYEEECRLDREDDDHLQDFETFSNKFRTDRAKFILDRICNVDKVLFDYTQKLDFSVRYTNWDRYLTRDNGGIGFIVFVDESNKTVHVYARSTDLIPGDHYEQNDILAIFNRLVGEYEPIQIFIGKSTFNEITEYSGSYGDRWDGNSILLRIGNISENRYLYRGDDRVYNR